MVAIDVRQDELQCLRTRAAQSDILVHLDRPQSLAVAQQLEPDLRVVMCCAELRRARYFVLLDETLSL